MMQQTEMSENNHFVQIGKTLYQFQQEGFLCDTVLQVEGNEYKAHSVVLASASAFFKSIYLENTRCGDYYIQMPGFDCDTVEAALCYIYTGKLLLPPVYKQTGQLTKLLTSLQQLGFDLKTFNGCQMAFTNKDGLSPTGKKQKKLKDNRVDHNYNADKLNKEAAAAAAASQDVTLGTSQQVTLQIKKPCNVLSTPVQMTSLSPGEENGFPKIKTELDLLSESLFLPASAESLDSVVQQDEKPKRKGRRVTLAEKIRLLKSKSGEADEFLLGSPSSTAANGLNQDGSDANSSETSRHFGSLRSKLGKKKPQRKLHLCAKCGKYFTSAMLAAHAVVHSGLKPYSCDHCDKVFSYKKNLYRHSLLHRGSKPYLCEVCGAGFTQKANLKSHIQSGLHGGQPPERSCPRRPRQPNEPGQHVCPMCENEFSTSVSLKLHINRIHQQLLMSYANEDNNSVDRIPSKLCDCCGRYFSSEASLKAHRWRTHKKNLIQCPICKKLFTCRALLITHSVVHTGEKPFACPKCDKKFRFKGAMRIHYRIHTGERPYKCEFCARRFHQTSHLKRHRRTHTGEKPYVCLLCKKTYKNRLDLRLHCQRVHQINIKQEMPPNVDLIKHEFGSEEVYAIPQGSFDESMIQALVVETEPATA